MQKNVNVNKGRILTLLQFVSEIFQLHIPKEVQCHLQSPFSDLTLIILFTLKVFLVIWTQHTLEYLQLILHKGDDLLF